MRPTGTFIVLALLALAACDDAPAGPSPATQLAFDTQPADDTVGSALPAVTVTARDAQGGVVSTFTGAVSVALAANPGAAALSGTVTVNAVAGVATFSDLAVSKAEDGYTLSATSGTLTAATSAAFDVSEVVTRYALRYYYALDLETGANQDCGLGAPNPCPATHDFNFAYNSNTAVHSRAFHRGGEIAHLTGRTFASVHLADTAGAGFTTNLIDQPFDNTRTVLLRTVAGNVYKLGNPTEFGTSGQDSVRFSAARLN